MELKNLVLLPSQSLNAAFSKLDSGMCKMQHLIRVYSVCLQICPWMENKIKMKTSPSTPKTRNGLVQMIRTDRSLFEKGYNVFCVI